jgi:hypothetical protein
MDILEPKQEQYLNWLLVPAPYRQPKTEEAMAELLGVNDSTLRRWKKKPAFATEWKKRVEELQGSPERTQKLLDTIYERALGGDNKAAQLYLQATGRMAPTQVNVEHSTKVSEISDEELDALIASVAAGEKAARTEAWQA